MDYEKILQIVEDLGYFYMNGEDRCRDCGEWRWTGKHENGCIYAELVSIVKEGIASRIKKQVPQVDEGTTL